MSDRFSIHVMTASQGRPWVDLLPMIEGLFPIKFSFSREHDPETAGEILTGNAAVGVSHREGSVSSLGVPQDGAASGEGRPVEIEVQFTDDSDVPFPFRKRRLRTKVAAPPEILSLSNNERILATCEQGPVWSFSEVRDVKHFRSAFALPVVSSQCGFQDVLGGQRFLEMLPLLHWIREIGASGRAGDLPLRACFIFDDPNLHWPRYGFVDYRQIAVHAEAENYHVSFATIPSDTWYTHSGTAAIFRDHQRRLSLSIHGNNHSRRELARSYTEAERIFLLRQAIRRIERLERLSGLAVARVMVPPHGACSEDMLASLPVCGFAAACISHGSLRAHNKIKPWTKTLGYWPAELVRGCPVLPRWGLFGEVKNTVLLAAYLNQAIILRGHHQDLKCGPELLDELAQFINGLGVVQWLNMTDVARSNCQMRIQGNPWPPEPGLAGKQSVLSKIQTSASGRIWFLRRLLTEGRDRFLSAGR
jgi:hypothetical protein